MVRPDTDQERNQESFSAVTSILTVHAHTQGHSAALGLAR